MFMLKSSASTLNLDKWCKRVFFSCLQSIFEWRSHLLWSRSDQTLQSTFKRKCHHVAVMLSWSVSFQIYYKLVIYKSIHFLTGLNKWRSGTSWKVKTISTGFTLHRQAQTSRCEVTLNKTVKIYIYVCVYIIHLYTCSSSLMSPCFSN